MIRYNVLFLCTGNSARSIIAEVLLNYWGRGRFHASSAGSHPRGEVHPLAIRVLEQNYLATGNLRSKSWDEFAGPEARRFDFVFTLCDEAAGESCPVWPGHPITAHWGLEDPAAAQGSEQDRERAFTRAFRDLDARIRTFTTLPFDAFEPAALKERLNAIGGMKAEALSEPAVERGSGRGASRGYI